MVLDQEGMLPLEAARYERVEPSLLGEGTYGKACSGSLKRHTSRFGDPPKKTEIRVVARH